MKEKERKREKGKGEEAGQDLCPWQGELKMRRRSCIWGSTFIDEEISFGRREIWRLKGEPSSQCVAGRIE